jgi:acyl-[acyl-carrier-protein]-phospholipid O-acyltransferase/long-chain-fatty-acid--[acyl-carrier-protein] ligase
VFGLIALVGVFGGLFLIPVESFIQTRPAPACRGAVLAAANFAVFGGILLSGPLSNVLNALWLPTASFAGVGVFSLALSLAIKVGSGRCRWV